MTYNTTNSASNTVRTTTLQTTQVTEVNKSTYTTPISKSKNRIMFKMSKNAAFKDILNLAKELKSTIDGGRLLQTGATRCTKSSYGHC